MTFVMFLRQYHLVSLRNKRFRGVWEQRKSEDVLPSRKMVRAGKTPENPVPRSFFAPKPHGNACYAGYHLVYNHASILFFMATLGPDAGIGILSTVLLIVLARRIEFIIKKNCSTMIIRCILMTCATKYGLILPGEISF